MPDSGDRLAAKSGALNRSIIITAALISGLVGSCALSERPNTLPVATPPTPYTPNQEPSQLPQAQPQQGNWYEGGTLHKAGAPDWQQATPENKLATCADFISAASEKKLFKLEIQDRIESMENTRSLAQELVTQMDAAMKEDSDSVENNQIYVNQTVSDIAGALMVLMGWMK